MNLSPAECFVLCTESCKQVTYIGSVGSFRYLQMHLPTLPVLRDVFLLLCSLPKMMNDLACPSLSIYLVQLEGSHY